jgi:hypothetical protein
MRSFYNNSAKSDRLLGQAEGVARLAENVWLLNLKQSTEPFGQLVHLAQREGIAFGLLAFEREPEWLPADFDPNTILAHRAGDRG